MMRIMPIIKSAKKKVKVDKRRTAVNKVYRKKVKQALKEIGIKNLKVIDSDLSISGKIHHNNLSLI